MEDEDSENGLVDTWSLWEKAYKDTVIGTSLSQINNSNVCMNEIEENRENCFYSDYSFNSDENKNSEENLNNKVKRLKKKNFKQVHESQNDLFDNNISITQVAETNNTHKENKTIEVKIEKMAEYTQYLGLQPALMKSECSKCNTVENISCEPKSNSCQCECSLLVTPIQENSFESSYANHSELASTSISESSSILTCKYQSCSVDTSLYSNLELPSYNNHEQSSNNTEFRCNNSYELPCSSNSGLTGNCSVELAPICSDELSSAINSEVLPILPTPNFKITRKVYLCAACETYFENWNLFLHMRETHKRHICLFCLGMFGQAERLSRHLSKKHNIPEITFQSVEEFYKTFKGSCYVMCCSCEKIFSETENFYNHFCSLDQNQQTSELCSIPQKISSVKTCNIDSQNNYENRQLLSNSKLYNINYLTSDPNITGIRRYSKRTIKPNRSNDDVYLYTKLKNIRSKRNKFQNTSNKHEISKCINEKFKGNNFDKSSIESRKIHNLIEDTVAETIMEVSKFRENVDNNESKIYASNITSNSNKIVNEIKSLNSNSMNNIYDNVTKTIMEVSSCKHDSINISQTDKISIKDSLASNKNCSLNKGSFESSDPKNEDDVRINQTVNNLIQTKDIGAEKNFMHDALTNYNSDCGSQICNSPSSPTTRSVFNPICDAQETSNKASKNLKLESKSLSSITSVTDRSLVIKICTKNNSIFSVQTPKHRKKFIENLENSKESEENNNGQISNNKISVLEKNDSIKNKFHTNEQDNDSSNNTVAVNDNYEDKNGIHNPTVILDLDKENKPNMTINHIDNKKENKLGESLNIQEKQINDTLNTNNIENTDGILLAGEEIPIIDLNVDSLLESMEIEDLLKLCIKAVCAICVYCNHARHIAVNGKQLSLHMLTEHRFQPQHPAIIIHQEQFTTKIKKCLEDLKSYYFNLDSYNSKKGTYNISTVKVYECFLCRFCSSVHKELYLHNRKMHQKPILICIMCKSTFCSYSELLCHLCPGVYAANINVQYRCCLCSLANLPSAFRLMVHLRKQHHACDVCLESTGNQQRLSNHVWKHKLHHLCYRCGIAYRNKPDITKHLFWKHGTESVLCKKCLQKKWPHIYHFCIPPTAFACEECGFSFSRAVALKVHKRIHTGDFPYSCFECSDKFISKKLLAKHEQNHKELSLANEITLSNANYRESLAKEIYITTCSTENNEENYNAAEINTEIKEPVKKVVDVYDLPPLNLSSDSDSDIEDNKIIEEISTKFEKESNQKIEVTFDTKVVIDLDTDVIVEVKRNEEDKKQEEQIMDGIWDNFKSYTASLEKQESSGILIEIDSIEKQKENGICKQENGSENSKNIVLTDHDYCIIYSEKSKESVSKPLSNIDESIKINEGSNFNIENIPSSNIVNRQNIENDSLKKKYKSKKKKQNISTSSSDSSSDSDSSSCSCGTNCSCSSSSSSSTSSSSSSSDSESSTSINLPCKIHLNREKRKKEKEVKDKIKEMQEIDEKEENKINKGESIDSIKSVQLEIMESDLDTSETETDEDFYDEQPQQLVNKILEEKRNRLVLLDDVTPTSKNSDISSVNNGIVIDTDTMHSSTPTTPVYPLTKMSLKRRIKARKRKRDVHGKVRSSAKTVESIKLNIPKLIYQKKEFISKPSSIKKYSSSSFTDSQSMLQKEMVTSKSSFINLSKIKEGSTSETDVKRSSKRKRVPKRFYGDSSDEENHKLQMLKWRRVDISPSIKYQLPSTSKNLNHKQNFKQKEKRIQYPDEDEGDEDNETENERIVIITPSGSDSNEPIESCSDSTDSNNQSDSKNKNKNVMLQAHIHYPQLYPPNLERANNLYCYCQCPYDEVSEMIACDGDDCQIEWFHFECVGIMIPPKGKWYCPDCRRRLGIPDEIDDFHNG